MIIILAIIAAVVALVLFVLMVCGIRAADRRKDPFNGPRNEVEHLARIVLMFADRRTDLPTDDEPSPDPDRERWR